MFTSGLYVVYEDNENENDYSYDIIVIGHNGIGVDPAISIA